MKQIAILIACWAGLGLAQNPVEIRKVVSTGSPTEGWPRTVQIDIPEIFTSVTLVTPPYVAMCPATIYRDFALEKVNPAPGKHLIEETTCDFSGRKRDSVEYNLKFLYKLYDWNQKVYYLYVISASDFKMEIMVTDELPVPGKHVMGLQRPARLGIPQFGGQGSGAMYLLNGKAFNGNPASPYLTR